MRLPPAMDLMQAVARNLRRLRTEKGLSQEELADRAGVSSRYLGALERSEYSCTVTILGQLAEGLGVEPAELVRRG